MPKIILKGYVIVPNEDLEAVKNSPVNTYKIN